MKKRLLALLLCLLLPVGCLAEETPTAEAAPAAPTLRAEGRREIAQTAGSYVLRFETAVYQDTMDAAREAMAQRVQQLRDLLEGDGVTGLRFTQANVRTLKEYFYTKLSQTVTTSGYAATCDVEATVDADGLDALLSALQEGGMAESFDILPSLNATPEARDAALNAAAEDAAHTAELLAQAMGRELDTLLDVNHTQDESTVTVQVTYSLK